MEKHDNKLKKYELNMFVKPTKKMSIATDICILYDKNSRVSAEQ